MPASFPGALPPSVTAGPSTTLANAGHATALHQKDRDEIIALGTKVGLGSASGTPGSGVVLVGTGAGTSAWQSITSTFIGAGAVTAAALASGSVTSAAVSGAGAANTVYGPSGYTTTPTVGTLTATGSITASGGININTSGAAAGELKTAGRILAEGDIIGRAGGLTVSQSATATAIAADGEILTSHRILAGGPLYAGAPSGGTTQTNLGITNIVNNAILATGATDNVDTKSGLYLVYSHSQGGFCAFVGNAPQTVVQLAARTSSDQFDFSLTEPVTAAYRIWIFASYLGPAGSLTGTIQFKNRDNGTPLRSHSYSVQKWGLP